MRRRKFLDGLVVESLGLLVILWILGVPQAFHQLATSPDSKDSTGPWLLPHQRITKAERIQFTEQTLERFRAGLSDFFQGQVDRVLTRSESQSSELEVRRSAASSPLSTRPAWAGGWPEIGGMVSR